MSTHQTAPGPWAVLLVAGGFEIGYAVSTGGSRGFTDLPWSIAAVVFAVLTIVTLSLALKNVDVGIGYAVWTGIGASGAAVVSAVLLGQPLTPLRVFWLAVIISGVVVLKLAARRDEPGETGEADGDGVGDIGSGDSTRGRHRGGSREAPDRVAAGGRGGLAAGVRGDSAPGGGDPRSGRHDPRAGQ